MLHRILHRFCEVILGYLEVMFRRDGLGIADPRAHDVQRVFLSQFGFTGTAEILKQLCPGLQARPLDDPSQLRSEICVRGCFPLFFTVTPH